MTQESKYESELLRPAIARSFLPKETPLSLDKSALIKLYHKTKIYFCAKNPVKRHNS